MHFLKFVTWFYFILLHSTDLDVFEATVFIRDCVVKLHTSKWFMNIYILGETILNLSSKTYICTSPPKYSVSYIVQSIKVEALACSGIDEEWLEKRLYPLMTVFLYEEENTFVF